MTYLFISDPGHGWLVVSKSELRRLGIADKITSSSYQSRDGTLAYLEEDCDYSTFHHAFVARYGNPPPVKGVFQVNTLVRNLPSYRC